MPDAVAALLTIALTLVGYVALYLSGRIRGRAMYWRGRYDESRVAQANPESIVDLLVMVRGQVAEALGERYARQWVDDLDLDVDVKWSDPEGP